MANHIRAEWFDEDDPWGPFFRGQQRSTWGLCPKLYRDYGTYSALEENEVEDEMREEFAARAPVLADRQIAGDSWEWYFMMQHFGAPTRLLDWTEGALIALYFAVRDNPGLYDAAVWVLDPYELNRRAIDREEIYAPNDSGLPAKDSKQIAPWLPTRFSRTRIPEKPVAVYPTHTVRRISTQRSCFTVHGTDFSGLDNLYGTGCLLKILIPSFEIANIRRELETCGIDEVTIFPDLDGLGRMICSRWQNKVRPLPHANVHTRLRPSKIHKGGVGVFSICMIREGTRLFLGDNEEMLWIVQDRIATQPREIRKLYEDFCVVKNRRYGCPLNFNRLTLSWYINEPMTGERANVACDGETYDFIALRDIQPDEELTVDYSTYSDGSRPVR